MQKLLYEGYCTDVPNFGACLTVSVLYFTSYYTFYFLCMFLVTFCIALVTVLFF